MEVKVCLADSNNSWPSFWGKIMQQKEVWLNYFKRRRQYRYLSTLYNKFPRYVTVRTCRFVGCHGPVATLLRRRGNVVMGPWQRCYGPVATLIWARGNVDMGPWQRTRPHTGSARCLMISAKTYVQGSYTLPSSTPSYYLFSTYMKDMKSATLRLRKGSRRVAMKRGNGRGEQVSRSGRWDS